MGKPTVCIGENKGADQLRRNRLFDFVSPALSYIRCMVYFVSFNIFYANPTGSLKWAMDLFA